MLFPEVTSIFQEKSIFLGRSPVEICAHRVVDCGRKTAAHTCSYLRCEKKKQITLDIIQNIILFTHFIRSQGALITSECDESSIEWTLAWSVLGFT